MTGKVMLSKPKDDAPLEEFKAWLQEFIHNITGKAPDGSITDEMWADYYKKFLVAQKGG
jgi:hypothetical protein